MKRINILLLITVGAFSLTATSVSSGGWLTQNKTGVPQSKPRPQPLPTTIPVDIDGKRLTEGERYVSQRTLKDGKVIAYRQNKREVEALIKALQEDGVTEKKMLDTNYWLQLSCSFIGYKQCSGKCPGCKYYESDLRGTDQTTRKLPPTALGICTCP